MTSDDRLTSALIHEVLDVLERHGYHQHAGQAIAVIGDLARIYEGTRDAPYGTYPGPAPPSPHRGPPGPQADPGAVILSAAEVRTVLFALDEAADDKRDRAGTCADCPDQSCPTCQWHLQGAQAYDQLAVRLLHDEQATRDERSQPGLATRRLPAPARTRRPTRRPASDQPRQDTRRIRNPPPSRWSPCPCPAAGGHGHARDP